MVLLSILVPKNVDIIVLVLMTKLYHKHTLIMSKESSDNGLKFIK